MTSAHARLPTELEEKAPARYPCPKQRELDEARQWVKAQVDERVRRLQKMPALPKEH